MPPNSSFKMNCKTRPGPADLAAGGLVARAGAAGLHCRPHPLVDLDSVEEHAFLSELASQLGIDPQLAAHVDAEARAT